MTKRIFIAVGIVLIISIISAYLAFADFFKKPQVEQLPKFQNPSTQNPQDQKPAAKVAILATNVEIPWSLVFLPDGNILFTERPGRVRQIDKSGNLNPNPVLTIDDVKVGGEGGLLGTAISPNFSNNHKIFFYYTYDQSGPFNQVVSYTYNGNKFTDRKVIIENIKGAAMHDGGRIKFGPDGFLYITAGDATNPSLAQDTSSTSGKILRITEAGTPAPGNPFNNNPVYSFGHRNPQGLAWDSQGRLWETEHGNIAHDELNMINAGKNYGWPIIQGSQTAPGMVTPVLNSENDTWAPSGAAILGDYLYFAGLRGRALYRIKVTDQNPKLETFFKDTYGRLRDVVVGPDKLLYVLTNNRDGRGTPGIDDDKILVINPQLL